MSDEIEYVLRDGMPPDVSGFRCALDWVVSNEILGDDDLTERLARRIGVQAAVTARRLMADRALALSAAALRDATKLPEVR